jgi:hypothetical protein
MRRIEFGIPYRSRGEATVRMEDAISQGQLSRKRDKPRVELRRIMTSTGHYKEYYITRIASEEILR